MSLTYGFPAPNAQAMVVPELINFAQLRVKEMKQVGVELKSDECLFLKHRHEGIGPEERTMIADMYGYITSCHVTYCLPILEVQKYVAKDDENVFGYSKVGDEFLATHVTLDERVLFDRQRSCNILNRVGWTGVSHVKSDMPVNPKIVSVEKTILTSKGYGTIQWLEQGVLTEFPEEVSLPTFTRPCAPTKCAWHTLNYEDSSHTGSHG